MATQSVITVQPFTITPGDDANTVYSKYHEHCVNTLTEDGNYDVNIDANLKANLKNIAPEKDPVRLQFVLRSRTNMVLMQFPT